MKNIMSQCTDEYSKLIRILDFRLPYIFKKIGLVVAVLIFALLLGNKFLGDFSLITKDILRTVVLLFMLMASLSKDKIEDEYNKHIRFQSYVIAIVFVAAYAILIPLISVVLDIAITGITGDGIASFYEVSAFEILFSLLGMQLLFFETLKRFGRAE